jgi:hypothetical protein
MDKEYQVAYVLHSTTKVLRVFREFRELIRYLEGEGKDTLKYICQPFPH